MKPWQAWKYRDTDLRVARRVTEAVERGEVILTVPRWLAPAARQWIFTRKVERADEKWAALTAEAPLDEWQRAMRRLPRQERGGDD